MKYHVTFRAQTHPEGVAQEQIRENIGAATALLIGTIIYPEDGGFSTAFVSLDGRTDQPLPDVEVWKTWVMLAYHLKECETLSPGQRELCVAVFESVKEFVQETEKLIVAPGIRLH